MRFEIQTKGVNASASRLERLGHQAKNAKPAFEEILDGLIEGEQSLWRRNGGGGAKKWLPNTEKTAAEKKSKGLDPRPMRATGALERSLTIKGAPGMIHNVDDDGLTFGTKLHYAQFSQFAKDATRKRVVVTLQAKQKKLIREKLAEHLLA